MKQRSQIYRGGDVRSCPATAAPLTIIGLAEVEKVLPVIEVSLSRGRVSAKPGRRRGHEGHKRFCEEYRSVVVRATWENSFQLTRQKSVFPERKLGGP